MEKKLFEIICAKDENKAREAAKTLINTCNLKEFKSLCEKMDFLFDFVKENVYKRLSFVINKENSKNIIKFFEFYSPYFDDFFAQILAKYADEDLTDEIYEILLQGTDAQKAYAASYFEKIPDTVAIDDLRENLNSEFEPLFENCASALGKMKDKISYQTYISLLNSDDDFVKLKAVKFLISFGDKNASDKLIASMNTSSMSENIAGEITALISPIVLFEKNNDEGVFLITNLINGLGEILPLENIFIYEIFEIAKYFLENPKTPYAALILFNLKNKFELLTQNEEYVFDLDRETKNEIIEIKNLLFSKNAEFWESEKQLIKPLITLDCPLIHTVLEVIKENNMKEFLSFLVPLLKTENETILYEILLTINSLDALQIVDKKTINFKNPNLKASFEQMCK